ncbi:MAG TPA: recombination mediator RecR [Bacilli bacterium]|jgi:recombination protein RecR|nr:recombination mediator RecR [Bacilli bacterium]HQC83258.1 recombination mediator RecR [Bacilli bacterium]
MIYPEILSDTINSFKKLPGIGEKSAERLALSMLDLEEEDIESFSENIVKCKKKLHRCKICGHLTDKEICDICNDETRQNNLICVVEDYKSVFMFEKSGTFRGKYHVLNGLISPIDGIYPEDINLGGLISRIDPESKNSELIIALKPSIEGETTTLYIKKIFENKNVKISRLSYGIPMGVDIDYLDSITLDRALLDRKEISDKEKND